MPWCEDCSKFWNANEMGPGGSCPSCSRPLDAPGEVAALHETKGAPWHFKVLLVGVTVYMVYRIYWLIEWLPKHI
jgi:hypothetical protein